MPIRRLCGIVLLAAAASTAACSDVKQRLSDTSAEIDRFLGVAAQPDARAAAQDGEPLYREGLAARARNADDEAFARFREAAELGHGAAAYELGLAYTEGRGTTQDLEAGAKWINTAAARGEPGAQFLVGAAYYGGTGVEQDYQRAVSYLADAAVQGHARAQYLLAEAFGNGRGVPKNALWAARWYGKAAEQGLAEAQFAYGVAHAAGLGLPKDQVAGYGWLLLAARQGHAKAEEVRQALAKKMAPEEARRAEARAQSFQPGPNHSFADGPTVQYVQQSLNVLGYEAGPVDGRIGPRTRKAISSFQSDAGLTADGAVSAELLRRLLDGQGEEPTP